LEYVAQLARTAKLAISFNSNAEEYLVKRLEASQYRQPGVLVYRSSRTLLASWPEKTLEDDHQPQQFAWSLVSFDSYTPDDYSFIENIRFRIAFKARPDEMGIMFCLDHDVLRVMLMRPHDIKFTRLRTREARPRL